jgi:hypothetical protein
MGDGCSMHVSAYKILLEKADGKRPLGRPRS